MDIYILRDGQQTGPFSLETTQTLLTQGTVTASDLAWRPGMPKWVPLEELVNTPPAPDPAAKPAETPVETPEPATAKQKALLSYLRITFPPALTKDGAARLVNDAMEDSKTAELLGQWNEERLRLHPDLFAAEIQAKKENRANRFFELCHTSGADYFTGITKAHCQVLVGFLDVKFPHWDAREAEAADHYFFPAVAEKFPQLVQKQWRGRLHYADGSKVAAEIRHKSPTTKLAKSSGSPIVAILKGVVIGGVILGVLYLAVYNKQGVAQPTPTPEKPAESTASLAAIKPAEPVPAPALQPPPAPEPTPPVAQADPAPVPTATAPMAATPEPAASPVAMTPSPAAPASPPPDPAMSPLAMTPSAVNTAPMATLPGAEPPVPPPPATLPTATTPTPADPLPPIAYSIPPLPTATPTTPEPAPAPTARTNLLTTKPVEIQLAYGKMTLPPGTPVKLISRQGALLRVNFRDSVITIPATSTDIE